MDCFARSPHVLKYEKFGYVCLNLLFFRGDVVKDKLNYFDIYSFSELATIDS